METVFRPRDERSPFICHLSFAFDSPVSPLPLLFPARRQFCPRDKIPKERSAKSSSRILARKSLDTRKRFGLFNPLKRMATRSIEERKLGQGRGNGQHLFGNHPLPPPPLFFPLSPILPTFFYHPRLSLSLSPPERVSVFFPNDKTKGERSFFARRLQHPPPSPVSISIQDLGRFRNERIPSLSSRNWKRQGIFLEYF